MERRVPTPPPAARTGPHGVNALHAVLGKYSFPNTLDRLAQQAGDVSFEFRRGQPVKLRDVLNLIEGPRPFDSADDAMAAVFAVLDERRGADRRISPPRSGRGDALPV